MAWTKKTVEEPKEEQSDLDPTKHYIKPAFTTGHPKTVTNPSQED